MKAQKRQIDNPFRNDDCRGDYYLQPDESVSSNLLGASSAEDGREVEQTLAFFANKGTIVSPTAEHQMWQMPGTEITMAAERARALSLQAAGRSLGHIAAQEV